MKLFIACLVFYSQMTQETAAEEQQPAPLPTCVRHVKIRTFAIRTISADHTACMAHDMSFKESSPCSCMASATKNGMNSFRVDKGVCYLYLALPPADDTGTQQIYVARTPAPGSEDAPVCTKKCCKDGYTKTAGGLCLNLVMDPKLPWEAALAACMEIPDGRLVEARTPEMAEDLRQYIKDNGNYGLFWVGIKRDKFTIWAWVVGGVLSETIVWKNKYPLGDAGNECGEFNAGAPPLLNFDPCNSKQPYICSGPEPATSFCPAGK